MLLSLCGALLIIANVLIPIAISIFATGFFPHKPFLAGHAVYNDSENMLAHTAPFDKVIFMVVDALRSDFVYSDQSGFIFTQSLIRAGGAIPFTAHATSPTITMPRIKAITTGSIPSFLDVILNFAESDTSSTLQNQDTWLAQLRAKPGGKIVMYGDDTWLKLFPDTFSRADGTSSFFVSDFTEVDNNVTRHVPVELDLTDWNGMIVHYLGLDHIGHKSGPQSPHMFPKQLEMDNIVKQMYEAIESKEHLRSTLLILCGDHGMNDAGNHGGSAAGETSPALVFLSPKLHMISDGLECPSNASETPFQYYGTVEQSDIAPTLAGLLGFPMPLNNLGIFIPNFLRFWPNEDDQIRLLFHNAKQVLRIVEANFDGISFDERIHPLECTSTKMLDVDLLECQWRVAKGLLDDKTCNPTARLNALITFLRSAQDIMSDTASNYDLRKLYLGVCVAALATILACLIPAVEHWQTISIGVGFTFLTLTSGIMMFASSYVEEEQHYWYWMTSGWLSMKILAASRKKTKTDVWLVAASLALFRITRRWNQTGQKYSGSSDIGRVLLPTHRLVLWFLVIVTFFKLGQRMARYGLPQASCQVSYAVAILLCLTSLGFKIAFTFADAPELIPRSQQMFLKPIIGASLVTQARAVFLEIGLSLTHIGYQRYCRKLKLEVTGTVLIRPLHDLITLFLITQSRVNNIPLFLIFDLQYQIFGSLELSQDDITLTTILLQFASFFAFGGSNAISSIDLSNAYNGISGYNIIAVGVLTFVDNWSGPLWWSSASCLLLLRQHDLGRQGVLKRHLSTYTILAASNLLFVMLACTFLRAHLFIWTVFSPKYLYSIAWSLGQHLCVNMLLTSALFWLGST